MLLIDRTGSPTVIIIAAEQSLYIKQTYILLPLTTCTLLKTQTSSALYIINHTP